LRTKILVFDTKKSTQKQVQLLHSGKPNKGEPSQVELVLCSGKAPLDTQISGKTLFIVFCIFSVLYLCVLLLLVCLFVLIFFIVIYLAVDLFL